MHSIFNHNAIIVIGLAYTLMTLAITEGLIGYRFLAQVYAIGLFAMTMLYDQQLRRASLLSEDADADAMMNDTDSEETTQ